MLFVADGTPLLVGDCKKARCARRHRSLNVAAECCCWCRRRQTTNTTAAGLAVSNM
jgi:hypothetical protein